MKNEVVCQRCGYRWITKSERPYVSCPYCLTKVRNPRGKLPLQLTVEEIRKRVVPILRRHGVKRAGLFGSVVRGDLRRGSDIDMLVELREGSDLMDLVELSLELQDALGRRVDVGEYRALKEEVKKTVLAEEVRIYEENRPEARG